MTEAKPRVVCPKCQRLMHPSGRGHTCAAALPGAHPMAQVAEMIADHVRARKAEPPIVIVAWLLPVTIPTVYCAQCVDATQAQRDRWKMIQANEPWPSSCALCGGQNGV